MPMFSTVIPAYNRASLIRQTLDGALNQQDVDQEIIVVDDGSTDGTPQIVESYGSRVKLFQQKNKGAGAARNLGMLEARGEYLAFLDSDDVWFPWTLQTYQHVIENTNRPAMIVSHCSEFSDDADLAWVRRSDLSIESFKDYYAASERFFWMGCSAVVVRRDEALAAGGFREVTFEDIDLWLRMGTAPGFVVVHAPVCFGRRIHGDNISWNPRYARGIHDLVEHEKAGRYPGGETRAFERRKILGRSIRPTAVDLAQRGWARESLRLYRESFWWQMQLGRWKYLAAVPVLGAWGALRRAWSGQPAAPPRRPDPVSRISPSRQTSRSRI